MYKAYWWFNIQEGCCSFAHKNFSFETVIGWVAWISLTSHHTLWNNAANIQLIKGTVFPWVKCQAGLHIYIINKHHEKSAPVWFVSWLNVRCVTLFFLLLFVWQVHQIDYMVLSDFKSTRSQDKHFIHSHEWFFLSTVRFFLIQNDPSLLLNLMVTCVFSPLNSCDRTKHRVHHHSPVLF